MTLLPMENKEGILCALKSFEKDRPGTIPPILEDYIKQIARDGRTMLPWVYIKPLLLHKFNKVIDGFLAESSVPDFLPLPSTIIELRQLVYSTLKKLDGIPFTIQRICELLENPFRHYNRPDKYLRGLEKVCAVVSTIDPQGNKIHREDPRFPSLAGLDEFGSPTSGGLQASPPSPCVDDLHRPHTSKSSDVDVVTDDDENEDEEDDDGTESSSHGSCTPPGGVSSISQTSVLTAACESGSWPFVANRLTLSPVLKPPLRDLAPDKLSSIENAPSSFSHQRMDSIASLEDEPVTESPSEENVDGEHSTTDLASSPVTSTDDRSHTHGSPTNGFSPVATTPPSFTDSELNVLQTPLESESSVAVVLRPIGQLEAFVQNVVGADGSCPTSPSGLLTHTPPGSIFKSTLDSDAHSSAGDDLKGPIEEIKTTESGHTPTYGNKRRSSPLCDELAEQSVERATTVADISPSPLGRHQTATKRRRLADLFPVSPDSDARTVANTSPSSALNDSPPIILCVPGAQTRDRESIARTSLNSEPTVERDPASPTGVGSTKSDESSDEHGHRPPTTSESPPSVTALHIRIDSETGEVEEKS